VILRGGADTEIADEAAGAASDPAPKN